MRTSFSIQLATLLAIGAAVTSVSADTLILSDFSSLSGISATGSWKDNIEAQGGSLIIGGTATNSGGFYTENSIVDWSAYSTVFLRGRVSDGHASNSLSLYLEDANFDSVLIPFEVSRLGTSFTTLSLDLDFSNVPIDPRGITQWGLAGGSGSGTEAIRLLIDSIFLSTEPIPEPSTYAALAGAAALGFVAWRRRAKR